MEIPSSDFDLIKSLLSANYEGNVDDNFDLDGQDIMLDSSNAQISEIIDSIRKVNVFDFISKLSVLNIIPQNQNKSVVFDFVINEILSYDLSLYKSKNIISNTMFRQIINKCMSLPPALRIDPIDSSFIYRLSFYGNYRIFNGINKSLGYKLQHFLNILFLKNSYFSENKEFVDRCRCMSTFILQISENIAEALNYDIFDLKHYEQSNLVFYDSNKMEKLVSSIIIPISIIDKFMPKKEQKYLFSTFNATKLNNPNDNYSFFYAPFLQDDRNNAIVLNPAMLGSFLINYFIVLAKEYNIYLKLINAFNEETWRNCKRNFIDLGHFIIDSKKYNLSIVNTDYYKDSIFSVGSQRIIWLRFFCDNGDDYDRYDMFGKYIIDASEPNKRWKEIKSAFPTIPAEHIYIVTISSSFSRAIINLSKKVSNDINILSLSAFEFYCISINERNHEFFIPRYIESKKMVNFMNTPFNMEFDILAYYVQNNYSFYLNDDVDTRSTNILFEFGTSIDYIHKALVSENKLLVPYPNTPFMKELILVDAERNIYKSKGIDLSAEKTVIINNTAFWITAPDQTNETYSLLKTITDVVSYWLGELRDVFCYRNIKEKEYSIEIYLSDEISKYGDIMLLNNSIDIKKDLLIMNNRNTISIHMGPISVASLGCDNNSCEKQFIEMLLSYILNLSVLDSKSERILESKFRNPLKKKVFCIDPLTQPYLKPINNGNFTMISIEYTETLLNEIGDYLKNTKRMNVGKIDDTKKVKICNDIVGYLFDKLTTEVKKYNCNYLAKILYLDLETIMYSMMLKQTRYSYDIACYPEKKDRIDKEYFDINKSSIAMKFLLEYVVAEQNNGEKIIDKLEYEELLSICSLIIDWSQNSDLFQYEIINSEMNMLKSGRIGIDKTSEKVLYRINSSANLRKLNVHSNPYIRKFYPTNILQTVPDELDSSFNSDYGYSFSNFSNVVYDLIALCEDSEQGLTIINLDKLANQVSKDTNIPLNEVNLILFDLSLQKRDNYLKPPKGYTKNDIWPWKFNRRLSFIRRPLININGEIYYGERQLYHSFMYMLELISNGKFHAKDNGKLKSLLGKIANKRGNEFNDIVANKISEIDNIICDSKVKKINGKKIVSSDNLDIGDIDILIILPKKATIIVSEVKDFSLSKNPYEIQQEYKKVFCDEDGKLCYLSKHKRRVKWINDHIEDVIKHYKLQENNKWKVIDTMILDESLLSNDYFEQQQNIILYSDLCIETLEKL